MAEGENSEGPDDGRRGPTGTVLLAAGGFVLLLSAFAQLGGLPFDMPRSWYQFRAIWVGLAVASIVAGVSLMRPPRGDERDTR